VACDGGTPPPDGGSDGGGADGGVGEILTILRDDYGVPHIYAESRRGAAYGLGWTDAEDVGAPLLTQLYAGVAQSTERLGAGCARCPASDGFARIYHIPEAVERDYAIVSALTREWIEGYVAGVDAYFRASPSASYDPDDPVAGPMVVGAFLVARALHAISATQSNLMPDAGGSNQLAITGARTAASTTLVLKDPHNAWAESERYVHFSFDGMDFVGNAGLGAIGCGSNDALAFGCTRAQPASAISVRARARHAGDHPAEGSCPAAAELEYFDHAAGGFVPLPMRCLELGAESRWVYEGRFGPVSGVGADTDGDGYPDTLTMAHVFAAADVDYLEYAIGRQFARTAEEMMGLFAAATPREDAQYRAFGSSDHHIGLVLGASAPDLDPAIDWTLPVSTDDPRIDSWTSSLDWNDLSAARWNNVDGAAPELPHVMDPTGDFVLNANGLPTFGTVPNGQVGDVPVYLEALRTTTVREDRLLDLVTDATGLDGAALQAIAMDVRVPFAPELADAARCGIAAESLDVVATYGDGGELLQILADWDGLATPDSEGATVAAALESAAPTLVYPAAGSCLTRAQLDSLGSFLRDTVAPSMRSQYASLHVPWGHVNFTIVGGAEHALPGMGLGRLVTVLANYFEIDSATGRFRVGGQRVGSRVTQVTSYSPAGFETWITSPHGQISEVDVPGSPHVGQSIDDYAARRMRRVLTDRAEVEAHLDPWGDEPGHEHPTRTTLALP
jgi:hypothetical protein